MQNKYIFLICFISVIYCCSRNSSIKEKSIFDDFQKCSDYLQDEYTLYKDLHQDIYDTINMWKRDSLKSVEFIFSRPSYFIDSVIIFNKEKNRLYANLIFIDNNVNSIFDLINDLGGAKINNKWYFFRGSQNAIDRATYQDSIYSPLTFNELSYLARKNLSGAFTKDGNGDNKVRETFFDFMDDLNGWGLPPGSTRADIDSVIVARNKEMHSRKIDPKEIEKIKAEMAKSVRPKEPIPDIKWYEKIFPKEKKLFETDEWKEYVRSKNQEK